MMAIDEAPPPNSASQLSLSAAQFAMLKGLAEDGPTSTRRLIPMTRRWLAQRGLIALGEKHRMHITEFGRMVLATAQVRTTRDQIPKSLL